MDKRNADISLQNAAYSPRKLLLIHSGVLLGVILLLFVVSNLMEYAIQPSGRLDAIDLQIILSTAQVSLLLIRTLATPFWMAGLSYVAIGIARGQKVKPGDLTAGFWKIGPIFSSDLLISLQYLWRMFLSIFISAQILSFTPVATIIYKAAENMTELTADVDLKTLLGADYVLVMASYLVVTGLVMLILVLPMFYRYRMTTYLIMDNQERSGALAMLRSRILMFGRRWELAKLDLSFWWYYLLLVLSVGLCYTDLILELAGVTLPVSEPVAVWSSMVLGLVAQLVLRTMVGPKVEVTYAHCYDRFLSAREIAVEASASIPKEENYD